jgi:glycosyltransferase involved in cell wall biosynthesis
MSDISICIPTYEFKGDGVKYLSELLDSLRKQTFKNFDVVVSDHSLDDKIIDYCESVSDEFEITYARNPNGIGNLGPNTNCALELAEGTICKVQYQDDLFVNDESLQKIFEAYEKNDCKWTFNGFCHTKDGKEFFNEKIPKWEDCMLEGRNLLGNPSGMSVLNSCKMYMNDKINLLVDTELYHRMRIAYGLPFIIEDVLTATREHENRTSSSRITYNSRFPHPEGGWLINREEMDYIAAELHPDYFENYGDWKYPDEE